MYLSFSFYASLMLIFSTKKKKNCFRLLRKKLEVLMKRPPRSNKIICFCFFILFLLFVSLFFCFFLFLLVVVVGGIWLKQEKPIFGVWNESKNSFSQFFMKNFFFIINHCRVHFTTVNQTLCFVDIPSTWF